MSTSTAMSDFAAVFAKHRFGAQSLGRGKLASLGKPFGELRLTGDMRNCRDEADNGTSRILNDDLLPRDGLIEKGVEMCAGVFQSHGVHGRRNRAPHNGCGQGANRTCYEI